MVDVPQLPGERLKLERQRRGLDEREVAGHLHLSLSYFRALEADDYEHLPGVLFIKGYLRNYARFLDLPPEELVSGFEGMHSPQESVESHESIVVETGKVELLTKMRATNWRHSGKWVVAIVVILLLGWWVWPVGRTVPTEPVAAGRTTPQSDNAVLQNTVVQATGQMATKTAEKEDAEPVVGKANDHAPVSKSGPSVQTSTQTNKTVQTKTKSGITPAAGLEQESTAPAILARLQVAFSGQCWVEVADATGAFIFKGERTAGSQLSLTGKAPFALTFGNGSAVTRVLVDGKSVSLPGSSPGDVIHLQAP
jgi:cytoskeleton protein RodZ